MCHWDCCGADVSHGIVGLLMTLGEVLIRWCITETAVGCSDCRHRDRGFAERDNDLDDMSIGSRSFHRSVSVSISPTFVCHLFYIDCDVPVRLILASVLWASVHENTQFNNLQILLWDFWLSLYNPNTSNRYLSALLSCKV